MVAYFLSEEGEHNLAHCLMVGVRGKDGGIRAPHGTIEDAFDAGYRVKSKKVFGRLGSIDPKAFAAVSFCGHVGDEILVAVFEK